MQEGIRRWRKVKGRRKMRRRSKICWKNRRKGRRSTRSRRRKGRRSKKRSTREGRGEGV